MSAFRRTIAILQPHSWLTLARESGSLQARDRQPPPQRKQFFNRRRRRDPLDEGFACTWRTRLVKVAAEVITRARRVIVRLSASWPHLDYFLAVSTPPAAVPSGVVCPVDSNSAPAETRDYEARGRGESAHRPTHVYLRLLKTSKWIIACVSANSPSWQMSSRT